MTQNEFLFHESGYLNHNKARQDHLASLKLPIDGKSVLELGAGIGDHTQFFLDRGCTVTVTDGRESNVDLLRDRFERKPNVTVALLDMEDLPEKMPTKQIVYCYGLLYHLTKPDEAIAAIALLADEMLLLETCVSPAPTESFDNDFEEADDPRASIHGIGCRPTRSFLFRQLKKHFRYVYFPVTQPNHPEFPTNWNQVSANGLIRSVVIASKIRLDNPALTESIPMIQARIL